MIFSKLKPMLLSMVIFSGLLYSGHSMGQIPNFTFGPKVGFSTASLTTNLDTLSEKFRSGLMGGLFFRWGAGRVYFQPEVLLVTKGGIFESTSQKFKEEVNLRSVDFPLMLGVRLVSSENFNLRIMGGPIACLIIDKSILINGKEMAAALVDDNIQDVYPGLQFGAGIDVLNFSLDVRWERGISDVTTNNASSTDNSWRQNLFNISLALKLL